MSTNGEFVGKPDAHDAVHYGDTAPSMTLVVECPTDKPFSSDTPSNLIKKFQGAAKEGSGFSLEGPIQWNCMNYDVTCKSKECEKLTGHANFWNSWGSCDVEEDDCRLIQHCVQSYVAAVFNVDTTKVQIILKDNGNEFKYSQCSCTSS